MSKGAGRSWGYWTQAKLRVLADYLDAFVVAASRPSERVYLEAFAGTEISTDEFVKARNRRVFAWLRLCLDDQHPFDGVAQLPGV